MRVELNNTADSGALIRNDEFFKLSGISDYIDGLWDENGESDGDPGVEAFLFGGGNLGFRLENSSRLLVLDFKSALSCGSGSDSLVSTHPLFDVGGAPRAIEELNNNSLELVGIEKDCHEAGMNGNAQDNLRGLLCITPGASRVSGFSIRWIEPDEAVKVRRFKLRKRVDQWVSAGENVLITRCCTNVDNEPTLCDNLLYDAPGQCAEVPPDDGFTELTWIYTAPPSPGVSSEDSGRTAGIKAQLLSDTVKGKSDPRDHGCFEMPFELKAVCIQGCP